jgi:hypothetical protein
MNKFFVVLVLAFTVALLGNRKRLNDTDTKGEAIIRVGTFWKMEKDMPVPGITISEKAWYKDSIGITEFCGIFTDITDSSQITTVKTIGYCFVDLKKKWVYEYGDFTDTSKIKRKYRYTDTTRFPGGWDFVSRTRFNSYMLRYMPDTTIQDILYKRRKFEVVFNNIPLEVIGSFRCDIKNTYFQMDTGISNKIGCPMVSYLRYPVNDDSNGRFSMEIKYISNHLPDSVLKVFAEWKRNEDVYPVR